MKPLRAADLRVGAIVLRALAALLAVSTAFWVFEDQINDALGRLPLTSPSEEPSSVKDLVVSLASAGIIVLANLFWLPGALVGTWVLAALAGLCALAAGYLYLRSLRR